MSCTELSAKNQSTSPLGDSPVTITETRPKPISLRHAISSGVGQWEKFATKTAQFLAHCVAQGSTSEKSGARECPAATGCDPNRGIDFQEGAIDSQGRQNGNDVGPPGRVVTAEGEHQFQSCDVGVAQVLMEADLSPIKTCKMDERFTNDGQVNHSDVKGSSDSSQKRKADESFTADGEVSHSDVNGSSDSFKKRKADESFTTAGEVNQSDVNGSSDSLRKHKADESFTADGELNQSDVNGSSDSFQKHKADDSFHADGEINQSGVNGSSDSFKKRKADESFTTAGEVNQSDVNGSGESLKKHKADESCTADAEVNQSNGSSDSLKKHKADESFTADGELNQSNVNWISNSFKKPKADESFTADAEVKDINVSDKQYKVDKSPMNVTQVVHSDVEGSIENRENDDMDANDTDIRRRDDVVESHEDESTANDEALAKILQAQEENHGQVIVID